MCDSKGRRQHHALIPLQQLIPIDPQRSNKVTKLSDLLADRGEDSPAENARRNLDYPAIMDQERISPKGRRVFEFLAKGAGSQKELARELKVAPSRITQIKQQLAGCLARHGYGPS